MHILTLSSRVVLGDKDTIEPGEYVVEDINGAQLLMLAGGGRMRGLPGHMEARRFRASEEFADIVDAAPCADHILIMRSGGFGDLILLTPVLREIKRRWPAAHLAVSTMGLYGPVLSNLPYVDEVLPYPLPVEKASTFDVRIYYENAIERNPRAKELHMTELFAEIGGVSLDGADLKPHYIPKPSEVVWAEGTYPRSAGVKRATIQVGASTASRIYPTGRVAKLLIEAGWEVMLLGDRGEVQDRINGKVPRLFNLTGKGHSFRESCAIVNASDVFIGSDSSLLHVAGALDVPAVGLYAAFPWQLRTKYSPSIRALSGEGPCSPCFHHFNQATQAHFPEKCPSAKTGRCGVLADIKPERVVAVAERIARNCSTSLT